MAAQKVRISVHLADVNLIRGTGFKGQARVILPTVSSCYECSLDMLNKPTAFPICTIANTPRLPEHCIEWASVLEWPKVHGGKRWLAFSAREMILSIATDKKLDTDDPEHIGWLYAIALARAKEFKIEGVTWSLTQGVVKNIIPAIASTNAIIAGAYFVHAPISCEVLTRVPSIMLQRGVQNRDKLGGLPQQLFYAHWKRRCIFVHLRA